jgi:signal transduction histidine kinase
VIYDEIGNLEKSAEYHHKALAKRIEFKDNHGIGVSYTNLAVLADASGETDSALYYSRQALHYKKQQNDQYGIGLSYINLGNHHRNFGTNDSALFYFNQAKTIFLQQENNHRIAVCFSAIGAIYTDSGLYNLANQNIDTALVLAAKAEAKSVVFNALLRGARLDSLQGNANRAYGRLRAARKLESEIFNLEKEELISNITNRYEVAKKEKELAENKAALAEEKLRAKQRGFWLWLLTLSILLLAAIATLVYRQQKFNQKALREEARLKEKLAAAELNKSLEEERVRISRDLHDHIGAQLTIISSKAD